jgi:signal transduction histidine kinase
LNLVTNALQAVGSQGKVRLIIASQDDKVVLSVKDNGCGIPAEDLERIFEPFFTTKSAEQGTGLGLSVSRGIVEKLGGKILVESEAGKGSEFRVVLPREAGKG